MKLSTLYPQVDAENNILKIEDTDSKAEISFSLEENHRVELSSGSREVQKIHEILQQTPEIRAERVLALKGRIENGEYSVEPQGVADKMLQDFISHHFI